MEEIEEEWVLYLIVKGSLKMSIGKTAAQIGHAVGMVYEKYIELKTKYDESQKYTLYNSLPEIIYQKNKFESWLNNNYSKIVLKADDKEFKKIKEQLECFVVKDLGRTEVPADSETCIALFPMIKNDCPKLIKRLQLLK